MPFGEAPGRRQMANASAHPPRRAMRMCHSPDRGKCLEGVARCASAALAAILLACSSPTTPGASGPLISTDAYRYTLQWDSIGWSVDIPYSFTNRTSGVVFVINCAGNFGILLERLDGDEWTPAWGNSVNDCLTPPIVIERGAIYLDTLHVWGAPPGSDWRPRFDQVDPSGSYRMVWATALSSIDEVPYTAGDLIPYEYRISNEFVLTTGP